MKRRIVGQCSTSDFKYLEHLSDAMNRGIKPDLTNLTNRQKSAVTVLSHFQNCGVEFEVLLKIKQVLIWEEDDGGMLFEYKLPRPIDQKTVAILMSIKGR